MVSEQSDEIYGMSSINWEHSSWKYFSLVGDEQVISLLHTKVYVFSDSVLCHGKMNVNPQSYYAWEDTLTWFTSSPEYRALDKIDSQPMEFECNVFRIHHIATLPQSPRVTVKIGRTTRKIHWTDLSSCRCSTTSHGDLKTTKRMQVKCSARFSLCKEIFSRTMVIPRTWIRKEMDSTHDYNPQGEWDRIAEQMMLTFAESKHPVSRSTSPFSRGVLKSKGGGKLSMHYCADPGTIETFTHNYFCKSAQYKRSSRRYVLRMSDLLWKDNLNHCSCEVWWRHTYFSPMILHNEKKIYCKDRRNELESFHNKIEWPKFLLMQDSWPQLKSNSISWRKTL